MVTLAPEATAGDPEALATRIARTYGGAIESMSGTVIVMRISPARAELLGRDANIQSIAAERAPERVASDAINWNTGVAYAYDGSGNVRSIGTDTYSYDVVGRLVEAHTGGVRRQYEYDAFGNRTRCTQGVSDPCQDTETISASSNRSSAMSYNAAGDVIAHAGHTYTFDEFHMLTSDRYGNLTREFIYDADDQRIGVLTSAPTGSWWRWTFRDPLSGKVLREFTSQGIDGTSSWKWEKDYIWRDGLLLATVQPNPTGIGTTTYHYHLDHLGTPRRITDNADVIVGVHDYHAFGPEAAGGTNERSLSLMKYTGHERDVLDGHPDSLDYMMARYYSTSLGRFLSVDPIINAGAMKSPQMWNRYSYTANNPVNRVDPDGRNWFHINGEWEWHKGSKYTDSSGKTHKSNYTHLLVAQATGTKNGTTTFKFTLYNQNKVAMTGTGFSGGTGLGAPIGAGNYKIRTDIRDPNGPTAVNPNSPDNNPPQFYGMQVIGSNPLPNLNTGLFYDIRSAYGPMRAYLNPMDGQRDRGLFFHGQEHTAPNAGQTHGCLCYGQNPAIINYLWKLTPQQVPVAVDVPVTPP